jgi:phosphoglucomutase
MVKFGTSGWRGVIGRDVTFRNVRVVTSALIDILQADGANGEFIVIGFDTRMLSEKFAYAAAELIASAEVPVRLATRDVPSPVLSAAVSELGASAGMVFTGSHNPPEYNGLKIYTANGILAMNDVTDRLEARVAEIIDGYDDTFLPRPELIERFDPKPSYLARLQSIIDWAAIRESGITLVVDPLFGTTREYLDHILLENEIPTTVIHNTRDPYFGGYAPDCTSVNLSRLRDVMRSTDADLGLATDGDGDRFGLLDRGARMCDSSTAIALVLDYLARRRGLSGAVGRTLATPTLIDAVAREHGLEIIETPVGFKHFGPLFVNGNLEFAGEESAGLTWARHLPERDGVLACLLAAEMVAVEGRSLAELTADLERRVGGHWFRRTQIPLTRRSKQIFDRRLKQKWNRIKGRKVVEVDRRDGLKLSFEGGSWLAVRLAGTEPKIRLYAEGRSSEEMRHLMHLARQLFSDRRL